MKRRVVDTGVGAVTSLGCKIDSFWRRILAGESGVGPLTLFDTTGHKVFFAGQINNWSTEGYLTPKDDKRIDRFAQFALVAAIDAVADSGLDFSREALTAAA